MPILASDKRTKSCNSPTKTEEEKQLMCSAPQPLSLSFSFSPISIGDTSNPPHFSNSPTGQKCCTGLLSLPPTWPTKPNSSTPTTHIALRFPFTAVRLLAGTWGLCPHMLVLGWGRVLCLWRFWFLQLCCVLVVDKFVRNGNSCGLFCDGCRWFVWIIRDPSLTILWIFWKLRSYLPPLDPLLAQLNPSRLSLLVQVIILS